VWLDDEHECTEEDSACDEHERYRELAKLASSQLVALGDECQQIASETVDY
jgi:hypothetical protein